jgi:predicted site-specific integrase-resolvase
MKLSEYARQLGITYKTAYRMWKAGHLDAYQLPTGTIIVREAQSPVTGIATYARVSSVDQKDDLTRQVARLRDYAAAKGYTLTREVREIASGVNDSRPKLAALLSDPQISLIIVEHRDRLTRFGFTYICLLLAQQHRRIEVMNTTDTGNDLVDDFVTVITSMAARLYGRRHARNHSERIKHCIQETYGDHPGL